MILETFSNLNASLTQYDGHCCHPARPHKTDRLWSQEMWALVVALETAAKVTIPLRYLFSTSAGIIYIHVWTNIPMGNSKCVTGRKPKSNVIIPR